MIKQELFLTYEGGILLYPVLRKLKLIGATMTINAMCLGESEKHMGFSLSRKNKKIQTLSNIASVEAIYSICALGMNSTS